MIQVFLGQASTFFVLFALLTTCLNNVLVVPMSKPETDKKSVDKSQSEPVLSTEHLFAGRREITIEHAGERYRLRITRRNKLLLQK